MRFSSLFLAISLFTIWSSSVAFVFSPKLAKFQPPGHPPHSPTGSPNRNLVINSAKNRIYSSTSRQAVVSASAENLREILKMQGFSGLLSAKGPLPRFPPFVYLITLMAAGFGFPVSEDLLVVYATVSEFNTENVARKAFITSAVWMGVVGSDMITYIIGSVIRRTTSTSESAPVIVEKTSPPATKFPSWLLKLLPIPSPLKRLLKNPFVGFYIRFMFGFRGPMMLWTGYEGKVGIVKFVIGTSIGALGSMGIQFAAGLAVLNRLKKV
mmetsp:Transcript_15805/g.32473  ORF Transcript_15805/g.32473 Transcript_15805/m.32473 type:complete len:268 (+) Transcript_15805:56-859(+)